MKTIQKALENKLSPYLILLAAVIFLIVLLSLVHPGIFFSGDGGLKYLILKQFNQSGEFRHIISTHPEWVEKTWQQGYYPFQPPFVYEIENEHMITFPVFFGFLSSFCYGQFGYYGIYIIPALSVLLTWVIFLGVLTELKIKIGTKALGLFLLAFCTPLTFYGAVFWEHSLATFLLFNAFIYFIRERAKVLPAFLSGLLAGMAIWFREETIALLGLVIATIAWNNRKFRSRPDIFFIIGTIIPVLLCFLFNNIVFGSIFGLHGQQIVGESNVVTQLLKGSKQFLRLNLYQLIYFPCIGVFYFILFSLWKKRKENFHKLFQIALVVLLFTLIVPFLLPSAGDKQWGPRFFLPVVPPVILVITIFADKNNWLELLQRNKGWTILFTLFLVYGVYMNVYRAGKELKHDYSQRVYPILKYIDVHPCPNIIVDHQYVAQELTEKFNSKNFFLLSSEAGLPALLLSLKSAGQQQCIFISINKEKTSFPDTITKNKNIEWKPVGNYMVGLFDIP
ncbi:MAG: hypothetical protein WDN26_18160 [Chitinophagaceae bacterium]